MNWTVSHHASKRVNERFGVKPDEVVAWVNEKMAAAQFVSNSYADDGNEARMFVSGRIILFADLLDDHIMSVRYASMPRQAAEQLAEIAKRELRRRQLRCLEREREAFRLRGDLELEKVDLRLEIMKSRSEAKVATLTGRLNAVEAKLRELAAEIKQARRELTHMAEGIVSLIS